MSRPFTDDDIKAVRDLCPMGSDSDVELALWRANGDRNVAVNMLLSQQPRPAGNAPKWVAAPTVAAQSVPREQAERSAAIRCSSCQEIMTVKVRGPRDESVEAEAACPRCHQMNRFVLPAEKEPVVASEAAPFKPYPQQMSANFEAFDTAHAPPLTPQSAPTSPIMESQAQSSLAQNMRIQSVQVGTLVPTLT
ncbi:Ca(2+)-dependent cysteine protease, partial [Perkinsus olseni]